MTATCYVRVKNPAGVTVAIIDHWLDLTYRHKQKAVGTLTLRLNGDDDRLSLFELDGQIEVLRSDKANSIDWYCEWSGFYRGTNPDVVGESGAPECTIVAVGYTHLLKRSVIAYAAESVNTVKTGAGETIMKAFVNENLGALATVANSRYVEGSRTGFSVQTDLARGSSWGGEDQALKNLYDAIVAIADATGLVFDIVNLTAGAFEFQVFDSRRGVDRSTYGLNPVTGKNGAGYPPVVFSLGKGNMIRPELVYDRSEEKNCIICTGDGVQNEKLQTVVTDAVLIADSTWNQCEDVSGQATEGTLASLYSEGARVLLEKAPRKLMSFGVLQTQSCLYGKDYWWGDRVTAKFKDFQEDLNLDEVEVQVVSSGKVERIDVVMR